MIETKEGYLHDNVLYSEVRGGTIEPVLSGDGHLFPGYYCLFGKTVPDEDDKYKLVFLKEGENISRDVLMENMLEDARGLYCTTIYLNQTQEGFMYALAKTVKRLKSDVRLSLSPFIKGNNHGVSLVADYSAKYAESFPHDTIIRKQIGFLDPESRLDDSTYSFFALCLLLGGFWIHTGKSHVDNYKQRQEDRIRKAKLAKLDSASRSAAIEIDKTWKAVDRMNKYRQEAYYG